MISYSITGTATNGTDFGTLTGSVTIDAGDPSATIDVSVIDDAIVEGAETVVVTLDAITSGDADISVGSADAATVTIADDSDAAIVTVSNATFNESDGTVTVDVTLDAAVQGGFAVDAILTDVTTDSGDFTTLVTPQNLSFTGSVGEVQTVTFTINDDAIVEGVETLDISLNNLVPATAPAAAIDITSVGTVTIDEDAADTAVVTVSNATFNESDGTVTVDVTLDVAVQDGFTVDAILTDVTTDSGDYTTLVTPQNLNFTGSVGEVQTVTFTINDDAIVEGVETLDISLNNLVPATAPAAAIDITSVGTVTIDEDADDTAVVTVSNATFNESDGTVTVDVTLDVAVQDGFTVDAILTDVTTDSGDFTSLTTPQNLSFTGGVGEVQTVTFTINDDAVVEGIETLEISLDNLIPATAPATAIDISSVGTVTIDEDANDTAIVSVSSPTFNEADGTVTVDVTLNADVQDGFTVEAILGGGTTVSADFTSSLSPQVLNFAGFDGEVQTVSFTINDDSIVEATETLEISLANLSPATAPAASIDITSVGTVTIEDNDSAVVTLTPVVATGASEQPVGTGVTNANFLLELSNESSTPTIVDFTATPDSNSIFGAIREGFEPNSLAHLQGDYRILVDGVDIGNDTQFTIPAEATSVNVTIEVIDDVVVELTENFDLNITGISSADPDVTLGATLGGNVTITDDDQAEIIVKSIQDATEPGQVSADNGVFQVLLVVPGSVDAVNNPFGTPAPVSYDVQVLFSVTGTANQIPVNPVTNPLANANPVDFEELESIVFASGVTTDVIAVTPEDDLLVEGDETVDLTLLPGSVRSNILDNLFSQGLIPTDVPDVDVTSAPAHQTATVIIEDNDVAAPAPQVEGIYVNGTNWTSLFRDRVDGNEDGSTFGYELTNRADPDESVPWINVDQIIIEFDSAIDASTVSIADFDISGALGFGGGPTPGILSAVAGPGNTVVLTLDGFLQAANVTLDIDSSGIQSTSGVSGVDSTFDFIALPGDSDMSPANSFLTVNAADITDTVGRQFDIILPGNFATSGYEFFSDLDGNGSINAADVTAATVRQFDFVIPV